MTCGTCKFWGNPDEVDSDFKSCTRIIHDESSLVSKKSFVGEEFLDLEEIKEIDNFTNSHIAVVVDGSGYYAALKSNKEFGCVLYEIKQ